MLDAADIGHARVSSALDEDGKERRLSIEIGDCSLKRTVIVAGPPAAGKGTQCDLIVSLYGLVHISIGQILRDHARRGTSIGSQAKTFMDKGELVPSELIIGILEERLLQPDVQARGCLLDSFPLTAAQADAMQDRIEIDKFIYIDVPHEELVERALGRRLDPETGAIYHEKYYPPPDLVASSLVRRSDDESDAVERRLRTYNNHIASVLAHFEGKVEVIDGSQSADEVFGCVSRCLDTLEWSTADLPYFGSMAFNGPFTASRASSAGFFSPENPPYIGDQVVCFQRGSAYRRKGTVSSVDEEVSDCSGGLRCGEEGIKVVVSTEDGDTFCAWSAFLAPLNDKEYSSVCNTSEFRNSCFAQLSTSLPSIVHAVPVPKQQSRLASSLNDALKISKEQARESLQSWLAEMEDGDAEPCEIPDALQAKLLKLFDEHADGSLYLYSTHQNLGPRTSLNTGQDYSLYYRALNNTLNSDSECNLQHALVLIHRMIYLLLYEEESLTRSLHTGGYVWKGDTQRPVPLNLHRLREAKRLRTTIRFRQFQSTTTDQIMADKYRHREDGRGYLWRIEIPEGFWGARDIHNVSWKPNESETLFPPYSAFLVQDINDEGCRLLAVDRTSELDAKAERHGIRGSAVELLDY